MEEELDVESSLEAEFEAAARAKLDAQPASLSSLFEDDEVVEVDAAIQDESLLVRESHNHCPRTAPDTEAGASADCSPQLASSVESKPVVAVCKRLCLWRSTPPYRTSRCWCVSRFEFMAAGDLAG